MLESPIVGPIIVCKKTMTSEAVCRCFVWKSLKKEKNTTLFLLSLSLHFCIHVGCKSALDSYWLWACCKKVPNKGNKGEILCDPDSTIVVDYNKDLYFRS